MVQLREKLEAKGHQVDMLGYDEDNKSVYIVNENRKVDRDKIQPLLDAKLNARAYPAIHANNLVKSTEFNRYVYELSAAYLGIDKYDIIHAHDVISAASLNRIRPDHIPLVATLHGSVAHEIRHQLTTIHKTKTSFIARAYFDEIERIGATSAEITIVANEWLKNILVDEFKVPEEQIKVLQYGFDTERFIKAMKSKTSIRRPIDKKVIIYTGRLVELKGVHHLLSALNELKKIRNDWVCWIIGSGDQQADLELQCKSMDLDDDVLFFGKRDDVPSILEKADIYVLPSLLENQPLSVIEAQIAGKAIIVSDAGGLPEMVENGVTGLVFPTGDVAALCKNLDLLLENEKYRNMLGKNAKKWGMSYWNIDKGVKNLMEVYKDAISKRKRDVENGTS
ncbi:glycosyl transferase [Weizmannia acidilactici]|uniref:Glycosyl transferase n=2 Tax=Weizmannia acidilactici TaxID=2607726 RepID=A0A5J4JKQ0_9BACI|nr:glycosyl transferase [Weizmannia acidilactici]GER74833.1 glycosyl transferase [Weizmannia acidilactici]